MSELDQRRKDERRKQRQLSQRRSGLTLEAMLLELQRRYTHVDLETVSANEWAVTVEIWVRNPTDARHDYDGRWQRQRYFGSSPLAAVVQAYRAVVSERDDKEEQR
jgi:hypothetical protein